MSVFEEFGIKRLSPSALKAFGEDRGLWFARYVARVPDDVGPAAWRGDAVEAGVNAFAYGQANPGQIAAQTFEHRAMEWAKNHDGELHPKQDEEEAKVQPCLERAIAAWESEGLAKLGKPASSQMWCECYLPGVNDVMVGGKWDWSYGKQGKGFSIDLKTSNSIPTPGKDDDGNEIPAAPQFDHAVQVMIYARARKEETAKILYVSSKEYKTKDPKRVYHRLITLGPDELADYERAAAETIISIRETLTAALAMTEYECVTKERALARLCRPNLQAKGGGYYSIWKPDYTRAVLEAVPAWQGV